MSSFEIVSQFLEAQPSHPKLSKDAIDQILALPKSHPLRLAMVSPFKVCLKFLSPYVSSNELSPQGANALNVFIH